MVKRGDYVRILSDRYPTLKGKNGIVTKVTEKGILVDSFFMDSLLFQRSELSKDGD